MTNKSIQDVYEFWESNPLWQGESQLRPGSLEWFEEHRRVVIEDVLVGSIHDRWFPRNISDQRILDLGCGPGFWAVEFGLRGCRDITAADLTHTALELTQRRCQLYGVSAAFSQQNAEKLMFDDESFTHMNCLGVIHHTPDTHACLREIGRVLEKVGTATISVYYKNIFIKSWPLLRWPGKLLVKLGGGLRGRGRENIFSIKDTDEIVRLYDGSENPIGKAFSRKEFQSMLSPYFNILDTWLYYFPARSLPFPLPISVHKALDSSAGFMISATVRKG